MYILIIIYHKILDISSNNKLLHSLHFVLNNFILCNFVVCLCVFYTTILLQRTYYVMICVHVAGNPVVTGEFINFKYMRIYNYLQIFKFIETIFFRMYKMHLFALYIENCVYISMKQIHLISKTNIADQNSQAKVCCFWFFLNRNTKNLCIISSCLPSLQTQGTLRPSNKYIHFTIF